MLNKRNIEKDKERKSKLKKIQQKLDDPNGFFEGQKQLDEFLSDKDNLDYLNDKEKRHRKHEVQRMNTKVIASYADSITAETMRAFQGFTFKKEQVTKITEMSNSLSAFVEKDIFDKANLDNDNACALAIERWIAIAYELHNQGNFFGAQAVFNGLSKIQITRLYQETINNKYKPSGLSQEAAQLFTILNDYYDLSLPQASENLNKLMNKTEGNKIGVLNITQKKMNTLNEKHQIANLLLKDINPGSEEYKGKQSQVKAMFEDIDNMYYEKQWLSQQCKLTNTVENAKSYPLQSKAISDSLFSQEVLPEPYFDEIWGKRKSQNKKLVDSDLKKFKYLTTATKDLKPNKYLQEIRDNPSPTMTKELSSAKLMDDVIAKLKTIPTKDLENILLPADKPPINVPIDTSKIPELRDVTITPIGGEYLRTFKVTSHDSPPVLIKAYPAELSRLKKNELIEPHLTETYYDSSLIVAKNASYNFEISEFCEQGNMMTDAAKKTQDQAKDAAVGYLRDISNMMIDFNRANVFFPDIKPTNFLINKNDHIVIADSKSFFGVQDKHIKKDEMGNVVERVVDSNEILPSLHYLPPELLNKDKINLDDLQRYQVGLTLYEYMINQVGIERDKETNKHIFDFSYDIFTDEKGQFFKSIIEGLTHDDPKKRLSFEKVQKMLATYEKEHVKEQAPGPISEIKTEVKPEPAAFSPEVAAVAPSKDQPAVPQEAVPDETGPSKTLKAVVDEILTTEKVFRLNIQSFYQAIKESMDLNNGELMSDLSPEDREKLAAFIEDYKQLGTELFANKELNTFEQKEQALKDIFTQDTFNTQEALIKKVVTNMGDFGRLLDEIKITQKGKRFYNHAIDRFNQLITEHKESTKIPTLSTQPSLNAITIMPNQRLMRYQLLFAEVEKNTPVEDKAKWTDIKQMAVNASLNVNQAVSKHTTDSGLSGLQTIINETLAGLVEIRDHVGEQEDLKEKTPAQLEQHSNWINNKVLPAIESVRQISYTIDIDANSPNDEYNLEKLKRLNQLYDIVHSLREKDKEEKDKTPLHRASTSYMMQHGLSNKPKTKEIELKNKQIKEIERKIERTIKMTKDNMAAKQSERKARTISAPSKSTLAARIKGRTVSVQSKLKQQITVPQRPREDKKTTATRTHAISQPTRSPAVRTHASSQPARSTAIASQSSTQSPRVIKPAGTAHTNLPKITPPPLSRTTQAKKTDGLLSPMELIQWENLKKHISDSLLECRQHYQDKLDKHEEAKLGSSKGKKLSANEKARAQHKIQMCNENLKFLTHIPNKPNPYHFKLMNIMIHRLLLERASGALIKVHDDFYSEHIDKMYKTQLKTAPELINKIGLQADLKKDHKQLEQELDAAKQAHQSSATPTSSREDIELPPLPPHLLEDSENRDEENKGEGEGESSKEPHPRI